MSPPIADQIAAEADAIASDPAASGPRWGNVHKLLLKAKVAPAEAARVIIGRDLGGLRAIIATLRGESPVASPTSTPTTDVAVDAAAPVDKVDRGILKAAMRAFRKRLKVTRLDHESRLGVGPLTGGKGHEVDAILPPRDFGPEVWAALVAEGQLRDVGRGFLALAEEVP